MIEKPACCLKYFSVAEHAFSAQQLGTTLNPAFKTSDEESSLEFLLCYLIQVKKLFCNKISTKTMIRLLFSAWLQARQNLKLTPTSMVTIYRIPAGTFSLPCHDRIHSSVWIVPFSRDQSIFSSPSVASLPVGLALWSLGSDSLRPLQTRPVHICSFN